MLRRKPTGNDYSLSRLPEAFPEACRPTLGAELELGIVDRTTGEPRNLYEQIRRRLPADMRQRVQPEFLKCQIEYASRPHGRVQTLREELHEFVSSFGTAARGLRAEPSWMANFPYWHFEPTMVTNRPRSRANLAKLGANAHYLATNSLHFHVAVPRSKAMAVIDGLQGFLPLFVALSANSPIHQGAVTGSKSYRCSVWSNQFAVCGVSSPYGSWERFQRRMQRLVEAGRVSCPKDLYYFVRPTRYGTIELRCCDLPANLDQVVVLGALYQTLVVALCEGSVSCRREVDVIRAELHQAYTHGIHAELTSHVGKLGSPFEWLERLRYDLEPVAAGLNTDSALALASSVLEDNGAQRQLRDYSASFAPRVRHVERPRVALGTRRSIEGVLTASAAAVAGLAAGVWLS